MGEKGQLDEACEWRLHLAQLSWAFEPPHIPFLQCTLLLPPLSDDFLLYVCAVFTLCRHSLPARRMWKLLPNPIPSEADGSSVCGHPSV